MLSTILFIVLGTVIGGIWGFIIGRAKRDKSRRGQPGIESAELGQAKGARWPADWRGIPRSRDGDGAT